jgi:Sir2- and TIR-associating SLOG family/SIR2-like domain
MADRDTEEFLTKYLKELKENNAAVFVGAGLSKAAGYVDWPGLMSPVAQALGLDVTKESDLVTLAQFHLNANASNRHQLNQLLIDEFSDLKDPTENHILLARLPIKTYWTTNYDRLIEKALEVGGRRVDAKYTNEQLATTLRGRDAVVYKMHGDIEHPDKAVLSKDDYERYQDTHGPFITALSGDLVEKTFLFLGFSFTDPNLDFVLSRIRTRFTKHQRQHYCIARKRSRRSGEKKADFDYAVTKQNLVTQDLMRFNIKTIFVDDFPDITSLIKALEHRFRRRTVFISGSADDFGSWGRPATEEFMSSLARTLIEKDLRIASGFGLGLGSAVVTGAVQQIYSTRQRSIDEQLLLRPFPIGIKDNEERKKTYALYREELIAQAGIAIFVMGNKKNEKGTIVNADGVRSEFDLAKTSGLYVVPVGSSGWMAEELWAEVMTLFDTLFPKDPKTIRPLLEKIGKTVPNPHDLLEPLVKLIIHLAKE